MNKKFRFQLLHEWIIANYLPLKVLDVAGGKGLLSYLLNKSGYNSTVIDPASEFRPMKYTDLISGERSKISKEEQNNIPRIKNIFLEEMTKDYDLIVGIHAHGCNIKIIDSCAKYSKDFILMPCCVVDEPIEKVGGINWMNSLEEYARNKGFEIKKDTLNFKGQNKLIWGKINNEH